MIYDEFIKKYNGKGIDFDNYYGYQCMDLAHQYATEVVGHDFAPAPAAKDVWNQTIDGYDKIANTPEGVPQKGDIVIWGVGVGPYGHIAVFDSGDNNSFVSFDQNWPLNSLCHFQKHNYTGVLGWFHPKSIVPPVLPVPPINDQTKIPAALLAWEEDLEVQQIRGKLNDLKRLRQEVAGYQATNNQQVAMIKELRKQLKECQSTPSTAPKTASEAFKLFIKLAFG